MTEPRTLAQRLGGRWLISVRGHLIALGVVLLGFLADVARRGGSDGLLLVGVLVAAQGTNALVDVVLHHTRWAHRSTRPVAITEALGRMMLGGVILATFSFFLRDRLGDAASLGTVGGFLVYPLVGMWVGAGIVISLDVLDQAKRLHQHLIEERSRSADIRQRADDTVAALRERIDHLLAPSRERLRLATVDSVPQMSPSATSDEIRAVAEHSVRRVSHDLWLSATGRPVRIRPRTIVRHLLMRPVLRPVPIVGLAVLLPLLEEPDLVRSGRLLLAAVAGGVVVVECLVINRALARWPHLRLGLLGGAVAVFAGQAIVVDGLRPLWGHTPQNPGVAVTVILTVMLVLLTTAIGSYRDLNDERATTLATDIETERLDAAARAHSVSERTRELATLLHGRVQSRLLGCAMAIEFAGADPVALDSALQRTVAVLDEDWLTDSSSMQRPFDDVIAEWSALAEVRVHADPSLLACVAEEAAVVVEEAVANAVRHGGARHVEVALVAEGDDIVITVRDDGTSPELRRPGLGTAVMQQVGTLEQHPGPDGWAVTVRLRPTR